MPLDNASGENGALNRPPQEQEGKTRALGDQPESNHHTGATGTAAAVAAFQENKPQLYAKPEGGLDMPQTNHTRYESAAAEVEEQSQADEGQDDEHVDDPNFPESEEKKNATYALEP